MTTLLCTVLAMCQGLGDNPCNNLRRQKSFSAALIKVSRDLETEGLRGHESLESSRQATAADMQQKRFCFIVFHVHFVHCITTLLNLQALCVHMDARMCEFFFFFFA